MNVYWVCGLIASLGGLGGLANNLIAGELVFPQFDPASRVWRPGWVGSVLVGAIAALFVWVVYGAEVAGQDLQTLLEKGVHVTLAPIFMSIAIGVSGGSILTLAAQKQAERISKQDLADALLKAMSEHQPPKQ
jgi:hypothetical protein